MKSEKSNSNEKTCLQLAVWRHGGSKFAEKAIETADAPNCGALGEMLTAVTTNIEVKKNECMNN